MTFYRRRHESILMTGMLSCEQSTACFLRESNFTIEPLYGLSMNAQKHLLCGF